MENYAVFGNPINHSKSPLIHYLFAKSTQIPYSYDKILVPIDNFTDTLKSYFKLGGKGANITSPFKEEAFILVNKVTKRAMFTKTVNTIKLLKNGELLGDNTDGIGLIKDLNRLSFIKPNFHVLLIGAGGASRSVIPSLLSLKSIITITNRNFLRAKKLKLNFSYSDKINTVPLENLTKYKFDLIINATTSSLKQEIPLIPSELINSEVYCYDMYYQKDSTTFLNWCKQYGANKKRISDGLGMLIYQAAYSFKLWYGLLPSTNSIIKKIRFDTNINI